LMSHATIWIVFKCIFITKCIERHCLWRQKILYSWIWLLIVFNIVLFHFRFIVYHS
jgi:hypothetical protein